MKRVSVSDLRNKFAAIERMLRRGETIEITKRKRVVAKLMPLTPEEKVAPVAPVVKPQLPDFMGRLRKIYGNRVLKMTAARRIAEERDRY